MIPIQYLNIEELQEMILIGIKCQYQYVKVGEYQRASIICEYENNQPIFLFEAYKDDVGVYTMYPFKVLYKGIHRSKQYVSSDKVFDRTSYVYPIDVD